MQIVREKTEISLPFCHQFTKDWLKNDLLIAVAISGELLAIIESKKLSKMGEYFQVAASRRGLFCCQLAAD